MMIRASPCQLTHSPKTTESSCNPSHPRRYRQEIDGLRAIAVIAVILNHLHEDWLPGGFLGVDVFFVISGYVIMASIEGRADTALGPFLNAFYRRRIQRLAPALICCIAITGVLTCLFVNNPDTSLITGATALVGVSNLYLLGESTNYFSADASYNTFLQTWSLGVEEQFYLCFPVLAWWLLQRQRKTGSGPALPVLATLSLISLLGFLYGSSNNPASAYFLTPMRLWELLAGALIQQGVLRKLRLPAIAPMGMLLLSFWLTNDPPVTSTVLVVTATALLLPALEAPSAVKRMLMLPAARHLGQISYSLYLWHWSVICLARWTIGLESWRLPLLLLLTIGCAEASYHWIETPLRHGGWAKSTGETLLRSGVVTAALGGFMLWLAQGGRAQHLYVGQSVSSVRQATKLQVISGSTVSRKNCHLSKRHQLSGTSLADKALGCVATPGSQTAQTIFFAGDSHTSALLPLAAELRDQGFRIIHMSMDSCPFPVTRHGHRNEACSNFQTLWQDWIFDHAKPGDAVLIHGYWLSHLSSGIGDTRNDLLGSDDRPVQGSAGKRQIFLEAINRFGERTQAQGIRVLLLGAGPRLINRNRCLPEWFRPSSSLESCEASLEQQLIHAEELNRSIASALSPSIRWINPIPRLCPTGCNLNSIRHLLFDDDHLSAAGAKLLLKPVMSKLMQAQS